MEIVGIVMACSSINFITIHTSNWNNCVNELKKFEVDIAELPQSPLLDIQA